MAKLKDKLRILKAARERRLYSYKGTSIRLSADFSTETLQARRDWHKILKVMKSKELQPRLLYPVRLSFKTQGEIKNFPDKKNLKQFITCQTSITRNVKGTSLKRRGWEP